MDDIIRKLDRMAEEANEAKTDAARSEGILSGLRKTLKEDYNIKTVEAAKKRIDVLVDKKEKTSTLLQEKMTVLEESYDWD